MKNAIVGLLIILAVVGGCTQKSNTSSGIIYEKGGQVYINGVSAELEITVFNGDLIETESNSYCEIVFEDKNIFRVAENSSATINLDDNKIKIDQGMVAFVLGNIKEEIFEVETTTAIAVIRGTVFDIMAESSNQVYYCTCNGSIDFISGSNWSLNLTANHHHSLRLSLDEEGELQQLDSGLEYHDDAYMTALAEKVGLTIDWDTVNGLEAIE